MDFEESLLSPYPTTPPQSPLQAAVESPVQPTTLAMTQTGSPSVSTTTTSVTAPKFGGILGSSTVWIGGPPKEDFSGTTLLSPETPLCFRDQDSSSDVVKAFIRRTDGQELKFKRDSTECGLMAFADDAFVHMQSTGMDTVFYMVGADAQGNGAIELFTRHSRYTKAEVESFIAKQLANGVYDRYQVAALKESATWLRNSLDVSMTNSLRNALRGNPSGPVLWMSIVDEVEQNSLVRCPALAKEFESLKLSSFKGENVREYADKASELLTKLDIDGQLPQMHLNTIVNALAACSVQDFKVMWMGRRKEIQAFVTKTLGKEPAVVKLMPDYIHYQALLDEAKLDYANLQEQWGPAQHAKTQTAALMAKMNAQIANLKQELKAKTPAATPPGGEKKDLKCYECGKPGYTKKTCPDCAAKKKGGTTPNGDNPAPKAAGTGKWTAPKDGEPQEKLIDGVLHKYCKKCHGGKGRWTRGKGLHSTDEHKVGVGKKNDDNNSGNEAGLCAAVDQDLISAWSDNFGF